jgi:2-keto-4-pentenoate hydratase
MQSKRPGAELNELSPAKDNVLAIASAFVAARSEGRALPDYPGTPPVTLAEAYRIQDLAIQLDGRNVIGWKVGKINPPTDVHLGSNRLAGPVFAANVVDAGDGTVPDMPVFEDGFAAAEAELLLHVRDGHSGPPPGTNEAAKALVDQVRLGIEVASSPYPGINGDGPCVTASDFGNNAGLVLGPQLVGWQDLDLCAIPVKTEIDGELIAEATAATMLDGPYGAVRFLLENLTERGIDWSDGVWVSTGAITGVHPIRIGQTATATFGDYGSLSCRIIAARPH